MLLQALGLTTLEGLGGVTEVGTEYSGSSIVLLNNQALVSAVALENASFPAGTLRVSGNTAMTCAPAGWPAADGCPPFG